ncbi:MAG: acyl-CoA dehydrogenase family protein [Acidimicrobiia bacterium]
MTADLDTFRSDAAAWLAANLTKTEHGGRRVRGLHADSTDDMDKARDIQRKLYDAGYAGITYPKEYGGQGLSDAHERAFNEVAADYEMPDFSILGGTTYGVCLPTLLAHGSDAFKKEHLPKILRGDELWCQFFSEPEAGSDLAASQTRATKDGDNWVLNGAKIWSSLAHFADYGLCLTRTNWDVPKHSGLTWFAVPTNAKGLEILPIREINGNTGFCQEFFDDVVIPDLHRVGDVNQGWTVTQTMLAYERGAGREGPEEAGFAPLAPDLVSLARRSGRAGDPRVRQLVAEAHTNDIVQEVLQKRIEESMRMSGMNAGVAAYGKLGKGIYNPIRARIAMEIAGSASLAWKADDTEAVTTAIRYLNGREMSIAGGTNEMQRNGISERVLGLPREPSFDRDKPFTEVLRGARNWTGKVG